ncbi:MAG: zinc ABC transporter substrate-binding protein [Salinarimonas sp.]|nr:zinc ABC transporter substrate-binding protein [Salinarimonas sp.]
MIRRAPKMSLSALLPGRKGALPAFLALGLLATPVVSERAMAQDAPVRVLATVEMIADVARNVGGDCVQVEALLGPGIDPHYYSATASDVTRLSEADLILYVDFALEEQLAAVLERLSARRPTIGVLAASLDPEDLREDPDEPGQVDPHIWMDASLWARTAPVIGDALAEQRPDCADAIAARVDAYTVQLQALYDWAGESIATIPQDQRRLVTAHDAFEYYAAAYGMEASEAIEGISTASEASIGDIREVADYVITHGVAAVFVETTVSPRTIEALVQEVRARGTGIEIGGELYSDAMGEAGTPGGTYIGMIYENTVTIVEALGGTPAPLPEALADWAQEWDVAP